METIREWLRKWLGINVIAHAYKNEDKLIKADIQELYAKYDEMLTALEKQASKSSVFDREKTPSGEPGRYVPIARRRAMAERNSQGPQTHQEEVRANNVRAMERI